MTLKTKFTTFLILALTSCAAAASTSVTERIAEGEKIASGIPAQVRKAPLIKFPVGSVQPRGWLRRCLELQRDGLNGHLGSVSAWLDKNNNQWLSDTGDHGWEEVPYWLRGYSSLAYILGDKAMIDEAQVWFDAVFANAKEDGFFGPRNYEGDRPELWAQMVMLWALQTYYEYSGDKRVLDTMTRFFKWEQSLDDSVFIKGLWEEKRGGDNLWSLRWLYNITGDDSLLPLADKLHRNTSDWTMDNTLPNWHGVNVAQGFREPATYFMFTGDSTLLDATHRDFEIMRKLYGQVPGGMYGADENARQGYSDPRQGAETCAVVEQMASDEILMQITGDPFWADHCEDVAFNTFPAAMTPDLKALRYITSPNMAISDEKLHGPSIDNNLRGMLSMSPFSSRCCQHNHGMGWPYYAEHLVMATADKGLAAMLYSANETTADVADGKTVRLTTETLYPFGETVTMTVGTDAKVRFPLYLRIPSWCRSAKVKVNGKRIGTDNSAGKYVRIDRTWKNGDRIELTLPMEVTSRTWKDNKGSISVNYGPLTLSLKIDETAESHDSRDRAFVQDDSHWQENVDSSLWPSYVLRPASPWNYALKTDSDGLPAGFSIVRKAWPADDYPFTPQNVPLEFTATGNRIPSWGYDATGMTDILPAPDAPRDSVDTPLRLIPMGAARLRISAFPQ